MILDNLPQKKCPLIPGYFMVDLNGRILCYEKGEWDVDCRHRKQEGLLSTGEGNIDLFVCYASSNKNVEVEMERIKCQR